MHKEVISSYRKSIDNHIFALVNIKHSEEDYKVRVVDINWCIDQVIKLEKEQTMLK